MRVQNPLLRKTLTDFGQYVGEMLPKYVQKVEVTNCEELDIMIHPEGIIPTMQFLKDHHNAQFLNIIDIAGMDVPTRPYRFEVVISIFPYQSQTFQQGFQTREKNISILLLSCRANNLQFSLVLQSQYHVIKFLITVKMIFTELNS